jgi:hypothetical protein
VTNREVAVVALGRFLVVERYRETHHPLQGPGEDRTGEQASRSDARSGSRGPARPQPG